MLKAILNINIEDLKKECISEPNVYCDNCPFFDSETCFDALEEIAREINEMKGV